MSVKESGRDPKLAAPELPSLTRLLHDAAEGDARSAEAVLSRVYEELRHLARRKIVEERPGHTLQATALVNEAYLRLIGAHGGLQFCSRAHFFHAAAEAMRRVLIGHARARSRLKRGGGVSCRVPLEHLSAVADVAKADADPAEILAVDEAIRRLEGQNPEAGAVVRLRFYAGLSPEEAAEALGLAPRTVYRHWSYARAWLFRELRGRQ